MSGTGCVSEGMDADTLGRYEIAKGTNMIDYAKQLAEQVKGMEGVDDKMPGEPYSYVLVDSCR